MPGIIIATFDLARSEFQNDRASTCWDTAWNAHCIHGITFRV